MNSAAMTPGFSNRLDLPGLEEDKSTVINPIQKGPGFFGAIKRGFSLIGAHLV